MSVKIEMEMPTSCRDCLCFVEKLNFQGFCGISHILDCTYVPMFERHQDCPLQEVKEL